MIIVIKFKSTDYTLANRLKMLNDEYESNIKRMESTDSQTMIYRELYEENIEIANELKHLINRRV